MNEEMGEKAQALTLPPPGPPDVEKLMALAPKYHIEIQGPPPDSSAGCPVYWQGFTLLSVFAYLAWEDQQHQNSGFSCLMHRRFSGMKPYHSFWAT